MTNKLTIMVTDMLTDMLTHMLTDMLTEMLTDMLTMMIRHLAGVKDIAELKHVFRSHDRAEPAY